MMFMIHPTMLQNFSLTMLQNIKVLKKKKKKHQRETENFSTQS